MATKDDVLAMYAKIGRTADSAYAPDKAGVDFWVNAIESGAVTPEQFEQDFLGAAAYNVENNPQYYTDAPEVMENIRTQAGNIGITVPPATTTGGTTTGGTTTGTTATQPNLSDAISGYYQSELGRTPDQAGLDWWTQQAQNRIDAGMSPEQALGEIQAGINADMEGIIYDLNNPNNTGMAGVDLTQAQQDLINSAKTQFGGTQNLTFDQIYALDQAANQGLSALPSDDVITGVVSNVANIDPVTGLPTGTTGATGTTGTTGATGTTGTTGGLIGAQPTSAQLTPFQQASLAQNQALLGTMQAAAGPRGSLATTNYSPYVNPYTSGVINATMADLERQRQMQQNQIGYQATQAGAFGGSRHGVAEALTNEAMQRTMANTAAQQRQAAFQQAQGAAQFDIGSELAQRQQGLSAAQQMSNLGQTSFGYGTDINAMLSGVGAQQQALQQAQIDAAKGQYAGYQAYPVTGAGTFANILNATPHGSTQTYNPGLFDYLTLGASVMGGK